MRQHFFFLILAIIQLNTSIYNIIYIENVENEVEISYTQTDTRTLDKRQYTATGIISARHIVENAKIYPSKLVSAVKGVV